MIKFWTILMFVSIFLSIVAPIFIGMYLDSLWATAITLLVCISFFVCCVWNGILCSRKERAIRRKNRKEYRQRMNRMWNLHGRRRR
jgi:hypothetical protein